MIKSPGLKVQGLIVFLFTSVLQKTQRFAGVTCCVPRPYGVDSSWFTYLSCLDPFAYDVTILFSFLIAHLVTQRTCNEECYLNFSILPCASTISTVVQPTAATSTIPLSAFYWLELILIFNHFSHYTCNPPLSFLQRWKSHFLRIMWIIQFVHILCVAMSTMSVRPENLWALASVLKRVPGSATCWPYALFGGVAHPQSCQKFVCFYLFSHFKLFLPTNTHLPIHVFTFAMLPPHVLSPLSYFAFTIHTESEPSITPAKLIQTFIGNRTQPAQKDIIK